MFTNIEESIPVVQSKVVLSTMVKKKFEPESMVQEEDEIGALSERFSRVVVLNLTSRSLYAKEWLIFDSGATVNLIRDLSLFNGRPVPIPDDEVSVVNIWF